jgi:hypothetical protein
MTRKTASVLVLSSLLPIAACNNQYGAPADGQPRTWGEQHYLDNRRYQETIDHQQSD